jgi:hypothetical protein
MLRSAAQKGENQMSLGQDCMADVRKFQFSHFVNLTASSHPRVSRTLTETRSKHQTEQPLQSVAQHATILITSNYCLKAGHSI